MSRGECNFWELEHPIYPEFEADIRLTCQTQIELTSDVSGRKLGEQLESPILE